MEYEEIVAVVRQASGGIDSEAADRALQATLQTLAERLPRGEARHIVQELPADDPLVAEAQRRDLDIMPADQFWTRVRQRLGVDDTTARLATDAVLETLAERIAAGQVEDLIAQLDPLLHPPLRRGAESAKPGGRRMPLEEFSRRVAAREGADADEADLYEEIAEHARMVFATLAEAVSIKEWLDVIVELPEEYHGLFPPRLA